MRVLITGSRHWTNRDKIKSVLCTLRSKGSAVVIAHGCCRGADVIAGGVAEGLGFRVERFAVDHRLDGPWPAAGPRRNQRMLTKFQPDLVLAFPKGESKGTRGCIKLAQALGIPVEVHEG